MLKKRFDEIFEALKYTKALDQIKQVRKDQLIQVKLDTVELGHNKLNKERAARVRTDSEDLLGKITAIRGRVGILKEQIDEALIEQDKLFTSGQEFERIIAELDRYKHERSITKETLRDLSRNITEFEETDEELRDMQVNFATNMAKHDATIGTLRRQSTEATAEMRLLRSQLDQSMSRQGQQLAEAENHDRQLQKRLELVKTISRQHSILGFDIGVDDEQLVHFRAKLEQVARTQAQKLELQKQQGRNQEENIDQRLQELLRQRGEMENTKTSARTSMRTMERKLKELQAQIDNSPVTEITVQKIEENLKEAENNIISARAEMDKHEWDRVIREHNTKLRSLDDQIENLNSEISACNRQADTRAKLGLLQADKKKKEDMLQAQVLASQSAFSEAVKKPLELRTMESELRVATSSSEAELEDAEKTHEVCAKEVSQLTAQLSLHKQQLKTKKNEESNLNRQVLEVFENLDTADDMIAKAEHELEKAQGDYYQAQFAVKMYDRAAIFANNKDCCQLCLRQFHSSFTINDFLEIVDKQKSAVPKHLANAQERIDIWSSDLANVKRVQPARASLAALADEIPVLERSIRVQQESLTQVIEASERASERLQQVRSQVKAINALDVLASNMRRIQREIADDLNSISTLEIELGTSGSSLSVDDMQRDLTSLQEQSKRARNELNQLTTDRDTARARINTLDGQRRDILLTQAQALAESREKQQLLSRFDECREAIAKSEQDLLDAERKTEEVQPEIDRLRTEFQSVRRINGEMEEKLQRGVSKIAASQNSLSTIDADIDSYLLRGGPDALKRSRNTVEMLQGNMQAIEKRIAELSQEIRDTENRNNDLQGTERNINDNLRLRKIKSDITKLEDAISDLESKNAEQDRDKYIINSKKLKDRYSRLVTERAGLMGEMNQLDKSLVTKQKELDVEYKDADEIYRRQLIKVRTMEKANEDLDKYGRALDSAIMKYHALKMNEINKIIDELWKATYCGTDVDSISIQSEGEAKASNRSYNYRVCMVKGEAELDMRGRCSAGQKVLASIIIRLALAECFGVNCGILALDEPTTNLDRDNIESLGKSLANIISVRRAQKNFQLIVITHDEEFLRMMGCSDYCDYYYRVSRNEHQKSIIERQRVSVL